MDVVLACPNCKRSDELGTVEDLLAVALLVELRREGDTFVPVYAGESDVSWDSQEWDGKRVDCRACIVTWDVSELVPAPPDEDEEESDEEEEPTEDEETYTVAQIREAFENHATPDDWGVKSFYDTGLISALRGEYDKEATG